MVNLFSWNNVVLTLATNILWKKTSNFSKKIIAILSSSAILQTQPVLAQEQDTTSLKTSTTIDYLEPQKQEQLKIAKALEGDSVSGFMLREFWKLEWWNMLVEKWTWKRVIDPRKDLIAWKDYILSRNEEEAQRLISMFQKKSQTQVTKQENKEIENLENEQKQVVKNKKEKKFFWILENFFDNYIASISHTESRWNHKADNSKIWKKFWVRDWLHAKGEYQFTNETLASMWYDNPKEVEKFKKSPEIQAKVMKKFTHSNFEYALKSDAVLKLLEIWLHPSQILAVAHHRWVWNKWWLIWVAEYAIKQANPIKAFYNKLQNAKWDWAWTTTYKYVILAWKKYNELTWEDVFSTLKLTSSKYKWIDTFVLAKNEEIIQDDSSQKIENKELKNPETSTTKYVSTIASNDNNFIHTKNTDTVISKIKSDVIKVAFIDQTPKIDTSVFIKKHYKQELLSKIAQMNFSNLNQDQKARLIDKLSKVDDLEVYYQNQIDYHRNIIKTSSNDLEVQKSKRILPWLEKLLNDTSRVILALNDEKMQERKVA